LFDIFLWIKNLMQWIFVLSFGIGLANLLPLGPVDGGRMLQIALQRIYGDNEKGNMMWRKVSMLFLFILAVNILFPILKALLGN
jgi:membrane-associated protease RseP (regulator of RpoE activity)